MTDIEQKARELANEVLNERGMAGRSYIDRDIYTHEALCRAIEQHEATKQERDNLATALKETAAACADHVNTILQLRSELADYKQEVSDAVQAFKNGNMHTMNDYILEPFIIRKPKPDPLVETLKNMDAVMERLEAFRAALEALEIEIREKGQ